MLLEDDCKKRYEAKDVEHKYIQKKNHHWF